jgi:aldose 1-epimerase
VQHSSKQDIASFISIKKERFGTLNSGELADLYTLTNTQNLAIKITNYGGIITAIEMPDNNGKVADIVLGYDNIAEYEADTEYVGAIVGRYAGRIKDGQITIKGKTIQLPLNSNQSQLHGGINALNKQLWHATTESSDDDVSLILHHHSPDNTNGFPGNVEFCVKYTLKNTNEFTVEFFARTDKSTAINLTQHSYFNLAGHDAGSIFDHKIALNSDNFLPMNNNAYPTGEVRSVNNTPHDFSKLVSLNQNIDQEDSQIKIGRGYDNYWLLNANGSSANLSQDCSAEVVEPKSGRRLRLYTDQPSIILYTGNHLDGAQVGKNNTTYQAQYGLCLEPQRAFDKNMMQDNYKPFSTVLLEPEQPFYSKNVYAFDCIEKL